MEKKPEEKNILRTTAYPQIVVYADVPIKEMFFKERDDINLSIYWRNQSC